MPSDLPPKNETKTKNSPSPFSFPHFLTNNQKNDILPPRPAPRRHCASRRGRRPDPRGNPHHHHLRPAEVPAVHARDPVGSGPEQRVRVSTVRRRRFQSGREREGEERNDGKKKNSLFKKKTSFSKKKKKLSQKQIKRCIAQGVQFGTISQADADTLIANLDAYCAQQG